MVICGEVRATRQLRRDATKAAVLAAAAIILVAHLGAAWYAGLVLEQDRLVFAIASALVVTLPLGSAAMVWKRRAQDAARLRHHKERLRMGWWTLATRYEHRPVKVTWKQYD
jgi:hypothetical protein